MINKNTIPKHWEIKKLGEICSTTSGGTPSRKNPEYFKGYIPWVKSGELDRGLILDTEEKITNDGVENSSAKIFPKGTLLIALYGATIGKISFLGIDAATNQAVCGIYQNHNVNHKFLFYFLTLSKPSLIKKSIGGAQPNISQGILKKLEIPLPPLSEQSQIVSKIEELFGELDKGKQQLETVKQQLKTYRQAVLKYAFEGRFTNNNIKDGQLPEGWKWVKVKDVCLQIIGGGTPSTTVSEFWNGNIPWISSADIFGIKDIRPRKMITKKAVENSAANILPKGGIIIVTRVGLGKLAIAPYDMCFSQDNQGLILNEKIIYREYALLFLQTEVQNFKHQSRGTTINGVTKKQLAELDLKLPLLDEQTKIVHQIETRLSVCDKMEESVETALRQVESLRQSILKQAFEGKLIKPD